MTIICLRGNQFHLIIVYFHLFHTVPSKLLSYQPFFLTMHHLSVIVVWLTGLYYPLIVHKAHKILLKKSFLVPYNIFWGSLLQTKQWSTTTTSMSQICDNFFFRISTRSSWKHTEAQAKSYCCRQYTQWLNLWIDSGHRNGIGMA